MTEFQQSAGPRRWQPRSSEHRVMRRLPIRAAQAPPQCPVSARALCLQNLIEHTLAPDGSRNRGRYLTRLSPSQVSAPTPPHLPPSLHGAPHRRLSTWFSDHLPSEKAVRLD
ncbi:hypothetical protein AOLI_G00092280 [Acnodon oligacanthus]